MSHAGRSRRGFGRIRELPSGKFQAAYMGPDARLHKAPTTFSAKYMAEGWIDAERRLIERDDWTPPAARASAKHTRGRTLDDYVTDWLTRRDLKPRTRDHYQRLLDQRILPGLGDLTLKAITPSTVRAWHEKQDSKTPTMNAHAYALLRTVLGSALDEELITANPCRIRGAGQAKRRHKIEPASLEELATIVENMPDHHKLAVLLAAWCALRFGELAELRRRDIDLTNGIIKVRRGVVQLPGERIIGDPKSEAGSRNVAIPPHLLDLVRRHLAEHAEPGRAGLVFPAAGGGHLAPSTLNGVAPREVKRSGRLIKVIPGRGFYGARAAAGRTDLRFHDLRHTGAVLAAQTGATLAELMSRLGHSTPAAALIYQHAARDRDAHIAAQLSAMAGWTEEDRRGRK
ncbi:site-specific integrase [Ammonicoccus fulvus]|uniref:Site-specific integrase n=1 Tax=Ammonicoccus fulvus TaxID=3138240 RepID=A0ABZ3FSU3_9ACTN